MLGSAHRFSKCGHKRMKTNNTFEIHLDLDNCSALYDYICREHHERPPGGWDLPSIVNRARRSPDEVQRSKKLIRAHKRLAATHTYSGFFEKVREYDGKKLEANPSGYSVSNTPHPVLPPWLLPIFQPGDSIHGVLLLQVDKKIEAENIKVHLLGAARTRIRVYTDSGYFDYVGYEQYINKGSMLWQNQHGSSSPEGQPLLFSAESSSERFRTLAFEFHIPDEAQPSLPELVQNGDDFAHVSYYLKATIDKGKRMKRGNVVVHQPVWVVQKERQNIHYLSAHVLKTKKVGYFNPNNTIHCTVSLPQAEFLQRGKTLPAVVEVENLSSSKISHVSCRLLLTASYSHKAGSWSLVKKVIDKGDKVRAGPVEAGMCPLYQLDVPVGGFQAADSCLVPRGPGVNWGLIQLQYELCVVIKLKGLHRNMHMSVPLKVEGPESVPYQPQKQESVRVSCGGTESDQDPTDV